MTVALLMAGRMFIADMRCDTVSSDFDSVDKTM